MDDTTLGPSRPPRLIHEQSEGYRETRSSALRSIRSSSRSSSVAYGETGLSEGDTEDFWVDYTDSSGNYAFAQIEAELISVTDHAYIWLATSDGTTDGEVSSTFDPSSDLDTIKIQLLADAFEDVVFPEDTAIYGYERGGGDDGDGGIDGDQHISILVYDIDFDSDSSANSGFVAGYFWSKDDATADTTNVYSTAKEYPSNGKEMFYLDAWALEEYSYTIVSTLAHEYQHMINYAQEEYGTRTEASTWLDEFRSLATEDLLAPAFEEFSSANSYNGVEDYDYFEDGPGYWAYYFNYYYPNAGLNVWYSQTYDYAFASVFAAYLLRSYGGVAFMEDEVSYADAAETASASFIDAIADAVNRSDASDGTAIASGAATSFSSDFYTEILPSFVWALWGFGSDGTADETPFTRSDANAASSTASTARALEAYSVLDSSDTYTISPGCYQLSTSASIRPHSFTFHTSSSLQSMKSDSATLTLTAPEDDDVEFYLIAIDE